MTQTKRAKLATIRSRYGKGRLTWQQYHNKLVALYDRND